MDNLMQTATCTCGQLIINTIGSPESTGSHQISCSANLVYFHTDDIECTHGDAECITRYHEDKATNYYHCPECLSELFAVPQSKPSIVAVFGNCFQNAISAA